MTLQKQYHDELKMECEGITFSNLSNTRADNTPDAMEKDGPQSEHEEDADKQAEKDNTELSKAMMPRKTRGLLRAMEVRVLHPVLCALMFIDLLYILLYVH